MPTIAPHAPMSIATGMAIASASADPQGFEPQPGRRHTEAAHHPEQDRSLDQWRQREDLDHQGGPQVQREPVDRCSEDRSDDQRDETAQRKGQKCGDDGGAASQHDAGGDQSERRGRGDEHRLEHLTELHDAEVELDLEDRHPDHQTTEGEVLDELDARTVLRSVFTDRAATLVLQEECCESGEAGATDHHQVGGSPQGDVLAEDAVPDVVEREADQRVQPAAGH
jgi:hypothetical protein